MHPEDQAIIDRFHQLYHSTPVTEWGSPWQSMFWMGLRVIKYPTDLWVYQELIYELKPDVIVECGTERGGSALFMANMCDLVGHGEVVTIDVVAWPERREHPRISYLLGSSTSQEIVSQVAERVQGKGTVMVVLDSDHSKAHVLAELRAYSGFVTPGSYLIVEDTNLYGHPIPWPEGPGAWEAVEEFLRETTDFVVDRTREKFLISTNPNGYLKRVR